MSRRAGRRGPSSKQVKPSEIRCTTRQRRVDCRASFACLPASVRSQNTPWKSGCSAVCDQSIQPSTRRRARPDRRTRSPAARVARRDIAGMACDSHDCFRHPDHGNAAVRIHRQESRRIEPRRPNRRRRYARGQAPSSPISHITFWTLNELRRPHILSIAVLLFNRGAILRK